MNRRVLFIRHGATKGNTEHRYVGRTDEGLLPQAEEALRENRGKLLKEIGWLPEESRFRLFVSPMLRCRQTAELLFPGVEQQIVSDLRECDFGGFEYKNFAELDGNPDYQEFIDTFGESGFPGGETLKLFAARCAGAFRALAESVREEGTDIFVVHGGTIMALLDAFSEPHQDYYSWQVKNGEGFAAELETREDGEPVLRNIRKLTGGSLSLRKLPNADA